jgi:DNA-binding beta-propeller fold protein YncE
MRRLLSVIALAVVMTLPQGALAASVTATFPVGAQPYGVVVDPVNGRVYVANNGGSTVSSVDPASGAVTSANVGSQPGLMALDAAARRLYVSNSGDKTLSVVDVTTMRTVATSFDAGGLGIAVDPAAKMAFVASGDTFASVHTTDLSLGTLVGVGAPQSWFGVAVDPALQRVYVTNIDSSAPTLEVLDENDVSTVLREVALPKPVRFAFAVDPATHNIVLASEDPAGPPFANSELFVVDPNTLTVARRAPLGGFPGGLVLAPAKHRIYVTDTSGHRLLEVDDQTLAVAQTSALPWEPELAALHQDGHLYVAAHSANLLAALTVGNQPPVVDGVTLSPSAPLTNDLLIASVVAHDPDNDPLTFTYQWSRNGTVLAATGSALDLSAAGNGDRGDTIKVVVTASDGIATASNSASVVIGDSAPTVTVSLAPASPSTNTLLTATATGADADGDALTYTFTWKVNGQVREVTPTPNAVDGFDLSVAANGDRGDTVSVDVVASDGTLAGAVSSASAVVQNSAPSVTVSLSDATPRKKDVLVATAVGQDADNDALMFTYVWSLNGDVQSTVTTSDTTSTFNLRGLAMNGDTVTVSVTASDGLATSAPATATAHVTQGNPDH